MDLEDKSTYNENILMSVYKFQEDVIKEIKALSKNGVNKKMLIHIKSIRKKPISQNIIVLFYEQPTEFFNDYKNLLEKTSLFDSSGFSIFIHYFYVLYEKYKYRYDFQHLRYKLQFDIYENNFESFFKEEGKFLSIQDLYLDTPLHKLARLRDKKFFLNICQRLKAINILDEELLSIKNLKDEKCYDYIVNEIEQKGNIIIKEDFDIYYNFIICYPSLFKSLSPINKINITFFSLKITMFSEKLLEKDFDNTYNSIIYSLNKNIDETINYLTYPKKSGINYFNILFHICYLKDDYNKMINLFNELLNKGNQKTVIESLIIEHIKYVMRKMNSTQRKGKREIYYGTKLIKESLSSIFRNKDSEF